VQDIPLEGGEGDDLAPSGEALHRDLHSSSDDDDLSHWGRVSGVERSPDGKMRLITCGRFQQASALVSI